MKKHISITFLLLTFSLISIAQNERPNRKEIREKIRTQKIAFITTKVGITGDEAQKFWPLYNEFEAEIKAVKRLQKENHRKARKIDEYPSEASKVSQNMLIYHQKELDIKKKYHTSFSEILPDVKVVKLYEAERKFKEKLLSEIQKRKQPRPGHHPNH